MMQVNLDRPMHFRDALPDWIAHGKKPGMNTRNFVLNSRRARRCGAWRAPHLVSFLCSYFALARFIYPMWPLRRAARPPPAQCIPFRRTRGAFFSRHVRLSRASLDFHVCVGGAGCVLNPLLVAPHRDRAKCTPHVHVSCPAEISFAGYRWLQRCSGWCASIPAHLDLSFVRD